MLQKRTFAFLFLIIAGMVLFRWHRGKAESEQGGSEGNRASAPQASYSYPQESVVLHSEAPYHKVVIPFSGSNGDILVRAKLNGHETDCVVDTGCGNIVWQGLDLQDGLKDKTFAYNWFADTVPATGMVLNSLQIGDFTFNNPYSVHLDTRQSELSWSGNRPVHVLLGNYAFQKVVLTIDYARRLLILRDKSYDISRIHPQPSGQLSDFTYESDYSLKQKDGPQCLCLNGFIEGHPARMRVDTGYSNGILLMYKYREKLRDLSDDVPLPPPYTTMGLSKVTQQTRVDLHWSVGTVSGVSPGYVLNGPFDSPWLFNAERQDAFIGYQALQNYRITIDYSRKKMLLEQVATSTNVATSMNINGNTIPLPHNGKHPTLRWVPNAYGSWDETPNEPSNPPLRWAVNKDGHYEEVPYYDKVTK